MANTFLRTSLLCAVAMLSGACGGAGANDNPPADVLADVEPEELFNHGVGLAQRGDYVRAEQYILAAEQRGIARSRTFPVLVRICVADSRIDHALHHAEPELEARPSDWRLRFLVASLQSASDRGAEALQNLQRVVQQVPEEPRPHYALGVMYRDDLMDVMRAREQFLLYLELDPEGEDAAAVRDWVGHVNVMLQAAVEARNQTGEPEEVNDAREPEEGNVEENGVPETSAPETSEGVEAAGEPAQNT